MADSPAGSQSPVAAPVAEPAKGEAATQQPLALEPTPSAPVVNPKKLRAQMLAEIGVADETELQTVVGAGRDALAKMAAAEAAAKDPATRKLEQTEKKLAALEEQTKALQAERDAAVVRDAVRDEMARLPFVDGASDLVMALLGVGPKSFSAKVEPGKPVTLLDADGDEIKGGLAGWLKKTLGERPFMQRPASARAEGETTVESIPKQAPARPAGGAARVEFIAQQLRKQMTGGN